ncbi:nucleoside hydrolase-like isoform X1 [Branchiostoma lanceolatum]|uniref:nucleoside hydrolase-like isoform X1 n=1 Tax=Branchiostoma lanceolatum TaxID=7740 RepID=UPI003451178A
MGKKASPKARPVLLLSVALAVVLLALSVGLGVGLSVRTRDRAGQQVEEKLVILDVDPGIDDAIAMLMVLSQPAVRVLAVTCVRGNARDVQQGCRNALRVLRVAGRMDISLYVGASLQLMGHDVFDHTYWSGVDGMGDVPDVNAPDYSLINQSEHAALTLIQMSKAYPNQITLIALGPLTNVALARRMDPDISSRFKEIIIMGGNIRGVGNMDIAAEFNFWMDPEAAQVVLREYKCPMKVVPWEVCQEHGLEWDFFSSWLTADTPKVRFIRDITNNLTQRLQQDGMLTYMCCDPLATAVVMDNSLAQTVSNVYATVETKGEFTRAQMVVDWGRLSQKRPNIDVMQNLDMARYKELLTEAVH